MNQNTRATLSTLPPGFSKI